MKRALMVVLLLVSLDVAASCRSAAQADRFKRMTGFPHGRPGYVVDHICALAQGGIDDPINMQWQSYADSKVKDKVENTAIGKARWCTPFNSTPTRQVFNCK